VTESAAGDTNVSEVESVNEVDSMPGSNFSGERAAPRVVKSRLFGEDASDHLQKQVIKARLLRNLQHPTGGAETREEGEAATEPSAAGFAVDPVRIGRYAILRKLGQGGMGVVYVAFDENLDRKVAIKVLRGELSRDDRGRARMLREAQALARLSHPNVVQVHEVSQWNDHDYVAMEFIAGQTLDHWLAAKPRGAREVLEVMVQAGRGLEAAHAANLVHRDFKPANLLLGNDGRARVLDFGLARTVSEREPDAPVPRTTEAVETAEHSAGQLSCSDSDLGGATVGSSAFDKLLTVSGAVLGTPAYMAPEQHLGEPATALSDQFSFCVVLYEALYGRRPFKAKSRTEYAVRVTEGDIEAAPVKSGVPVWLRRVLVRGLAPVPADRWPSMAALLAELGRDRTRTGRRIVVATGLLAALGVALSISSNEPKICEANGGLDDLWGASQRDAVRVAFANTGMPEADAVLEYTQRSLDGYAQDMLAARVGACEARWVGRSQTDAQLELRTACLDQRQRELGAVVGVLADADRDVVLHAPELVAGLGDIGLCARVELLEAGTPVPKDADAVEAIARVRRVIAQAHAAREVGRIAEGQSLTAGAWRAAEQLGFEPLLGELHYLKGRNARLARDLVGARGHLVEAVAIAHGHQSHELAAQAWLHLALLEAESGGAPDRSLEFSLASAAIERLDDARYAALIAYARGSALLNAGKPKQALPVFDEALILAESGFVGSEREFSDILVARSAALAAVGRTGDARADLARVVTKRGSLSSAQVNALFNLAVIEIDNGELDDGERDMRAAIRGYEALFGPGFEAIGHGRLALAQIALSRDEVAQAEALSKDALTILDADHIDHDWALDGLASAQARGGDLEAAEHTLRRAIAASERTKPNDRTRQAYLRGRLGGVLSDRGATDEAIVEFDWAVTQLEQDEVDAPLDLATVLLRRGETRLAQGQALLALSSFEQAVALAPRDCGAAWLAGHARVGLADALNQLDLRSDERRELAHEAFELLYGVPSSADTRERARRLSNL